MAKKASSSEQKVRQIRRKSRKQYSGEEKVRIVLDGLRDEESLESSAIFDANHSRHPS